MTDQNKPKGASFSDYVRHAGEFVAQDVVGETVVMPPARWWDAGRSGRRAEATGTGKGIHDIPLWSVDFANNAQYIPKKNLPKALQGLEVTAANSGKLGGAVGKFMAPSWIGNSLSGKSGLVRGAANVGTALGVGLGVGIGGEIAASMLDETSQEMEDLKVARFYGDKKLEAKIMDRINSNKTQASNVRTLSHGISTGSMVGPQGAMIGGTTAAGVALARNAIGGEKHMAAGMSQEDSDKFDRQAVNLIRTSRASPTVKPPLSNQDIDEFLNERIFRVALGQSHPDSLKPFAEFIDIEKLKKDMPNAFSDRYESGHREFLSKKYNEKSLTRSREYTKSNPTQKSGKGFGN